MSDDATASVERFLDRLERSNPDPVLRRRIEDVRADLRGEWGPTAADCITAELLACVLGERSRSELWHERLLVAKARGWL